MRIGKILPTASFMSSMVFVIFISPLLCFASAAGGDAILGRWNTQDNDAQFEIYKCASGYCGKIVHLEDPNYSPNDQRGMGGLPKVDRENPDPRLRNRPQLGLEMLEGFRFEGGNTWKGRIYNPENGKTYQCRLSLADANHMQLRGYIGISLLGRTEIWTRRPAGSE